MKKPTIKEINTTPDNYIKIEFDYNCSYIFPYDDGITILNMFKNAEEYNTENYENHTIIPLKNTPTTTVIANQQYKNMKMAALLNITVKELELSQKEETKE